MLLIYDSNPAFAYHGSYDNIFENISLQIGTDRKLSFTGRNACAYCQPVHIPRLIFAQ